MYSSFVGSVVSGALQPIDIGQWRLGVEGGDPFRVQLGGTAEVAFRPIVGTKGFFYSRKNSAVRRTFRIPIILHPRKAMAPGAGQRICITDSRAKISQGRRNDNETNTVSGSASRRGSRLASISSGLTP